MRKPEEFLEDIADVLYRDGDLDHEWSVVDLELIADIIGKWLETEGLALFKCRLCDARLHLARTPRGIRYWASNSGSDTCPWPASTLHRPVKI